MLSCKKGTSRSRLQLLIRKLGADGKDNRITQGLNPVNAQPEKPLHVYPMLRSLSGQPRRQSSLPLTCSPCILGCTNIENDKTTSIHKVRLKEAISSLGNGPRFVSHITYMYSLFSVAHLQPFLAHTKLSFVTIKVSHKAYPVLLAPLQLQIQRALAELPHYMAVPCAMLGIFISGQSKLFRYSAIPLFRILRFTASLPDHYQETIIGLVN